MKIRYLREPVLASRAHPERQSVFRPRIRIRLKHRDRQVDILALIDSGTDDCLFPVGIAHLLGLQLRQENSCLYIGMTDAEIAAVFETVTLDVGEWSFPLYAGFIDAPGAPAVLGQNGFFNRFEVRFDLLNKLIELKARKKS